MRTCMLAAYAALCCACTPIGGDHAHTRRAPTDDPEERAPDDDHDSDDDDHPGSDPPGDPSDDPPDDPSDDPPDDPSDDPPDDPSDDPPDDPSDDPPDDDLPAHCANGPLDLPLDGCEPTPPSSTGDPHQDCVARINQFRAECQCLPPLSRWTGGEDCADRMAEADHDSGQAHGAANRGLCEWGYGQNECPGWGSVGDVIDGCLQMMWDEGPGANFWAHGHYLHMASTELTHVACGFYSGNNGTWAVQNFY